MTINIKRLRELEAKATKKPWHCPHIGNDSITVSGSTNVGVSAYSTIVSFLDTEQTDGEGREWHTDGTIEANRQLVCELRNSLPALLDELEAARLCVDALRAFYDGECHCHEIGCRGPCCQCVAGAALSAHAAAGKGGGAHAK